MSTYDFHYDWFTGNIPIWEAHLARYAGKQSLTFLEVGSWEGRSAIWLLENILTTASCTLHCIDPWTSPIDVSVESRFDNNSRVARQISQAQLVKHKGRSIDILPFFTAETIDLVYIDGSHHAKDVLYDILLSWRLLKPEGLLICDDYELEDELQIHNGNQIRVIAPPIRRPKMAIDAFLKCFEGEYRLIHKAWQVLIEKTCTYHIEEKEKMKSLSFYR